MAEEKKVAPVEDTVNESQVLRDAEIARRGLMAGLAKAPKMRVYGSKSYKESMGDRWTFLYNGVPVSISFDGTWQEYPEPVALYIQKALEQIAESNAPKDEFVKI